MSWGLAWFIYASLILFFVLFEGYRNYKGRRPNLYYDGGMILRLSSQTFLGFWSKFLLLVFFLPVIELYVIIVTLWAKVSYRKDPEPLKPMKWKPYNPDDKE